MPMMKIRITCAFLEMGEQKKPLKIFIIISIQQHSHESLSDNIYILRKYFQNTILTMMPVSVRFYLNEARSRRDENLHLIVPINPRTL
jgi:hypothetical protein